MTKLKGPNILVFASEAGSAAHLSVVIKSNEDRASFKVVGTEAGSKVFRSNNIEVQHTSVRKQIDDVRRLLIDEKPDVLLICRCINPRSHERALVRIARRVGIPSVSIIDEWYDYRANYSDESGNIYIPDTICCPDKQALEEAVADGIPRHALRVTGSPALSALIDQINVSRRIPPENPFPVEKSETRPVILLLSERISDHCTDQRNKKEDQESSIGYDEFKVRIDLANVLNKLDSGVTVIEKLHPSTSKEDFAPIELSNSNWLIYEYGILFEFFWWSNIVIGMRSIALLEAFLIGLPSISYQPDLIGINRCTAVKKGLVDCIVSQDSLHQWLADNIGGKPKTKIRRPNFACKEAPKAVFQAVENLI